MKSSLHHKLGLFTFSLIFAIGLNTAPVLAQTAPAATPRQDVEVILSGKKVTTGADKREVLGDARNIKPGEVIEYQATYSNKGQSAVSNLVATVPIPEGTEYMRSGTLPASGAKATIGDGKFAPIPLKRKVKLPDGKEVEQDLPLAQYKAVQWSLGDLPPGKNMVVSARVRVLEVPSAGTAPVGTTLPGGQK